eukprot:CAMPEP_0195285638 /NCGR_PEP_ID=MMETSP0707-20130614/3398_1 /TAXON_ID=33640 /ORGANISM="Asterionellopsis glacialis, Strain CCMP134" /LENGTH=365 /DNA_ID=CAMNT_0040345161 /DNA_START=140 /DNA_END=1233 /DNA_ORIENTATION=+
MTLQDLDEEDHVALNGNGLRILPEKDKAGRVVLCSCRSKWHICNPQRPSMFRTLWFLVHAALKDEAVQRKGIVLVLDDRVQGKSSTQSMFDVKRDRVFLKFIRDILPTKIVGIHHIVGQSDDIYKYIIFPQFLCILGKYLRARYRRHNGDDPNTLLTELDRYGISCRLLVNVGLGQVTTAPNQPQLSRLMMRNSTPKTPPTNFATAPQDIPGDRITPEEAGRTQNIPLNGKRKRSSNKCEEDQEDSSKRPTGEAVRECMYDASAVQANGESARSEQDLQASLQDDITTVSKALPTPATNVGSNLVNLAGVVEGAIQKYTVTKETEHEDTGNVPIENIEDDDSRQDSCPSGFTSDQQLDENGMGRT